MAKTIKEKMAKIKELKKRVRTVRMQRNAQMEKDLESTRDDIKKLQQETETARMREKDKRKKLEKKLEKEWWKRVEKAIKDCHINYVDIDIDEETGDQTIDVGLTIEKSEPDILDSNFKKKAPRGKK